MPLSKQALRVLNSVNFPNNNSQYISPELLREFNTEMITAMELTQSMSEYAVLNGDNVFTGNNTMNGDLTVTGTISASVIHTIYETSSVIFSSGSNQLGDELTDVQTLSGSVKVQGTLSVNGIPVLAGQTTGSSLITASANLNVIDFTKGDGSQFSITIDTGSATNQDLGPLNAFTASQEILNSDYSASIARLNGQTGSYATTGSNTFVGNQIIDKASVLYTNGIYWNDSTVGYSNLEIINSATGNLDLAALNGRVRVVNSNLEIVSGTFTASLAEGYTYVGNSSGRTTLVATSSFGSGGTINTGSFATTGSNTFRGQQTIDSPSSYGGTGLTMVSSSINFNGSGGRINFPNGGYFLGNPGDAMQFTTDGAAQQFLIGDSTPTPSARALSFRNTSPNGNIQFTAEANGQVSLSGSATNIQGVNFIPFSQSLATNDATFAAKFATIGTQSGSWGSGGSINTGSFITTGSYASIQRINGELDFYVTGSTQAIGMYNTGSDASGSMEFGVTDPGNPFIKLKKRTWFQIQGGDDLNYIAFTASFDNGLSVGPNFGSRTAMLTTSGSLGLFNPTTRRAGVLTNISASSTARDGINLAFINTTTTAEMVLSGSNNIFSNPAANTAGFRRFLTANNISINPASVPQVSSSMAFPLTISNNIINGTGNIILRGPVSSSTWTLSNNTIPGTLSIGPSAAVTAEKMVSGLSMAANTIPGTLNIAANQSTLTNIVTANANYIGGTPTLILSSSAMTFSNNIISDTAFVITNSWFTGSAGNGIMTFSRNIVGGQSNAVITTGSNAGINAPTIGDNFIFGVSNTLYSNATTARLSGTTSYSSATRNGILGNNLIVSASSFLGDADSLGSVFLGRFNANDGVRNKTSDIVFAVGTGKQSALKTGFLIDSGSNTFVEGTLNVSGATSLNGDLIVTGSVTASLTQGYVWVGDANNKTTLVATSSFGGGGTPTDITALNAFTQSILGTNPWTASINDKFNTIASQSGSWGGSSINTGSFITTGSYSGNQKIKGSLYLKTINNTTSSALTLSDAGGTGGSFIYIDYSAFNYPEWNTWNNSGFAGVTLNGPGVTNASVAWSAWDFAEVLSVSSGTVTPGASYTFTGPFVDTLGVTGQLSAVNGQINCYDGPRFQIGTGAESAPGMGLNVNSDTNPGNIYAFFAIDDGGTINNPNGNFGFNMNTYTAWGSQTVPTIYGGGESNLGSGNTDIFQINEGILHIVKNTEITGSLNVNDTLSLDNGALLRANGNIQYNCGGFQTNITQSGSAAVSQSVNFEVTDISNGVSISNNSHINFSYSGTYSITFSAQLKAPTGADTIWMWLKKNGTNVPESATKMVLKNNEESVMTVNFLVDANYNDFFEIAWQSLNGDAVLFAEGASGNIPAIPSVIVTAVQVR